MRTGNRCTTLTKLPVAFWGGRRANVDPVPIVKPAMRPWNTRRSPYMSTYRSTACPIRRSLSCVSLKLASTQISSKRADRHQTLPSQHIVAGIYITARDDAINFRDNFTIAKVQFGLSKIAFGGLEFRLGLFDCRRLWQKLGKYLVDVALRIKFIELASICFGVWLNEWTTPSSAASESSLPAPGAPKKMSGRDRAALGRSAIFGLRPAAPRKREFGVHHQAPG